MCPLCLAAGGGHAAPGAGSPGRGRPYTLWFPAPAIHTSQWQPGDVPQAEHKAKIKGRIKKLGAGDKGQAQNSHADIRLLHLKGHSVWKVPGVDTACGQQKKGTAAPPPPEARPTKIAPDPQDTNSHCTRLRLLLHPQQK